VRSARDEQELAETALVAQVRAQAGGVEARGKAPAATRLAARKEPKMTLRAATMLKGKVMVVKGKERVVVE